MGDKEGKKWVAQRMTDLGIKGPENFQLHQFMMLMNELEQLEAGEHVRTNRGFRHTLLGDNMAYDNNMRGVLFKNDRKKQANHPDYTGNCEIDGIEMWMSAWIKEGKKGKFMSLSFKPKEENGDRRSQGRSRDDDEDIPF